MATRRVGEGAADRSGSLHHRRGIVSVRADILRENGAALTLARQLGGVIDTRSRVPYTIAVVKAMTSMPRRDRGSRAISLSGQRQDLERTANAEAQRSAENAEKTRYSERGLSASSMRCAKAWSI
jgi:hypothetical protein